MTVLVPRSEVNVAEIVVISDLPAELGYGCLSIHAEIVIGESCLRICHRDRSEFGVADQPTDDGLH